MARRKEPTIIDLAVAYLYVGDEEEIRLTEDWDFFWPNILEDPRLKRREVNVLYAIANRVKEEYIHGKDYDKVLDILSQYVSNSDLFHKDPNKWIDWIHGM